MAEYITRTEGVRVSYHWVAKLWREHGLKPHRQGTFKLGRDSRFAEKVADIVGLYLQPSHGIPSAIAGVSSRCLWRQDG